MLQEKCKEQPFTYEFTSDKKVFYKIKWSFLNSTKGQIQFDWRRRRTKTSGIAALSSVSVFTTQPSYRVSFCLNTLRYRSLSGLWETFPPISLGHIFGGDTARPFDSPLSPSQASVHFWRAHWQSCSCYLRLTIVDTLGCRSVSIPAVNLSSYIPLCRRSGSSSWL